jgi:hypothetical protein
MTNTLAEYSRHLERFGPECVLETAADDLSEHELGELAAQIKSLERVSTFKRGHWVERRQHARSCDECGLDLPGNARANMRRHNHCRQKAYESRRQALAA